MKPRHSSYANVIRVILMFVLMLPLLLPDATANATALHQDSPEQDAPTNSLTTNPEIVWNTFLGAKIGDARSDIAVDSSGNVYVAGSSWDSWGNPINAHAGASDIFVAKLDSSGALQWHTFLGSTADDFGNAIVVDEIGNVFLTGYSNTTWGRPINAHTSGVNGQERPTRDAFVAKLNSNGIMEWNTFLGASTWDVGNAIAVDSTGNIYLTGVSKDAWSPEMDAAGGCPDAFATKLNNRGILQWTTLLGSAGRYDIDFGNDIAVDGSGDVYITGSSSATWGNPINAHAGQVRIDEVPQGDAFAAKLNSDGVLQWNTFFGSTAWDGGNAIAVDSTGNIFVAGSSNSIWGNPINSQAGETDAFAAKLNNSGVLEWNTFFGSNSEDYGSAIAVDENGIYLIGGSAATWGNPINPHAGGEDYWQARDVFLAKLDSDGDLEWNTFLGSTGNDYGNGIAVDGRGNVFVTASSEVTWGSPINAHAGGVGPNGFPTPDVFVTKFLVPEMNVRWIYWCALLVLGGCLAILLKNSKRLSKNRLK